MDSTKLKKTNKKADRRKHLAKKTKKNPQTTIITSGREPITSAPVFSYSVKDTRGTIDYNTFDSVFNRRLFIGEVMYQLNPEFKQLTPIEYAPEYSDKPGFSFSCFFIDIHGIRCTKIPGLITDLDIVRIQDKYYKLQLNGSQFPKLPASVKILIEEKEELIL
jgi:hypothetical protein